MNDLPPGAAFARVLMDVVAAIERAGAAAPPAPELLQLLLQAYAGSGRSDLAGPLEAALTAALDHHRDEQPLVARAAWLVLFVQACAITDDPRMRDAVADLASLVSADRAAADVEPASAAADACLRAAAVVGPRPLVADAVDALEALVTRVYRPGTALAALEAHTALAAALLTAFGATGRIPYAMLADELMQTARRCWWDDASGAFTGTVDADAGALRVVHRLAALQRDGSYRQSAVVSDRVDYLADAGRLLTRLEARLPFASALSSARFGLALLERHAAGFR